MGRVLDEVGGPVAATRAEEGKRARFRAFFVTAEPRLRRALVAAYGPELGREAAADTLAWAWENFARVEAMQHPLGYLWRVGQTSVRRTTRRRRHEAVGFWPEVPGLDVTGLDRHDPEPPEPALAAALDRLSPRQRVAVVLVHGYRYTLAEVAELQGCGVSTVRNHLRRGMDALRDRLGVDADA